MRSKVCEDNLSSKSANYCGTRPKGNETDTRANDCEKLKIDLRDIRDENLKLQAVISDLTQVNKRWQKYNSDRQMYVQKLLNTIQDQQEQLNKMGEQRAFSNSEEEQDVGSSKRNYEQELARLQEVEMVLKEKVQVLEFQVKANRDDWEAELNEKKQVLKEKADIEGRVNELMDELQHLKQSILQKQRMGKRNICDVCRLRISNDLSQPASRLFRTAVHLPCSSQNWRGGMNEAAANCQNLELDGSESGNESIRRPSYSCGAKGMPSTRNSAECDFDSGLPRAESFESDNVTDVWNIGEHWSRSPEVPAEATSYSRASTVPLVSSPVIHVTPSNSNSSVTLIGSMPLREDSKYNPKEANSSVRSTVQIPIKKSSSAPESNSSTKFLRSTTDSSDPILSIPDCAGSTDTISSIDYDTNQGVDTLTRLNIICPACHSVFLPEDNLKFLEHFEACQRNL